MNFRHVYKDNAADGTLFLLHGTGGTKEDFLFFDQYLDKTYNLVGLQGNVDENGMGRFFRRLSPGVFDQENIREEAKKLHDFIISWKKTHPDQSKRCVFLGYSNGANMLLAALFYFPKLLNTLLLLHPMLPFTPDPVPQLSEHDLFVSMGAHDQMVGPKQKQELLRVLKSTGAHLTVREYPSGHEITDGELQDTADFLLSKTLLHQDI